MLRNRSPLPLLLPTLILASLLCFNNCVQRPQSEESTVSSSSHFQHADKMTSCLVCHIPDRPTPTLGYVHYNNQDCVTCHVPTTWSDHSWHFHNPAQPTCIQCHHKDQPPSPQGLAHYNNQDCLLCHQAALTPGITWASLKPSASSNTSASPK